MVHLRLIVPGQLIEAVLACLAGSAAVVNVIHLQGAAGSSGDLVMCDVAREQTSVVVGELRELGLVRHGSISVDHVDTVLSAGATAAERAAPGSPTDAVVWEDMTARTSESASLSYVYLLFMALAGLLAAVGIFYDSPILVVGAMVVGPEFGPVAGVCVALVAGPRRLAWRSIQALGVGFAVAIGITAAATAAFDAAGVIPDAFDAGRHALSDSIASPDFFSGFVAFCAGIAGMVSLTTAKSGALIGVLISVTTIPAAANVGVCAALGAWPDCWASFGQLALNIAVLLVAGTLTLAVQRWGFQRRRAAHRAASA